MENLDSNLTAAADCEQHVGKVLIVDNYDSFTYNIRGALAKLGIDAVVARNDKISMDEIVKMDPSHIIISPGPGTPDNPEDIGITKDVIAYAIANNKALLGVCLGLQALVHRLGGNIVQAPEIKHGKTSQLDVDEDGGVLFDGVDTEAAVMRYHSLAAEEETFPYKILRVTSRTRDEAQTIMSVECKDHPDYGKQSIFGVQFHPESFATPEGQKILDNFLGVNPEAYESLKKQGVHVPEDPALDIVLPHDLNDLVEETDQHEFEQVPFPCDLSPDQVYARLHAVSDYMYCFESLNANGGERVGRYSYFGLKPEFVLSACNNDFYLNDHQVDTGDLNAFEALNATVEQLGARSETGDGVPKEQRLTGGFVGGMSYEAIQYREPTVGVSTPPDQKTFSYGYFFDGLIYDNHTGQYFYYTRGENRMAEFAEILSKEPPQQETKVRQTSKGESQESFMDKVQRLRDEEIRVGNTFQTVISRREKYAMEGSMAPLYLEMRKLCPSGNMHAIKMGEFESVGSFPELTLSIVDGEATTYQVAGTCSRTGEEERDAAAFEALIADIKERAEHMMLVDLARNDLEMCSVPGTVELVQEMLMHRLNAGKVIHIASEVRSKIGDISPLRALLAVAPMGTVSGAPKVRSMQLIDEYEEGDPRGLYAGSFGFVDVRGNLEAVVGLRSIMRYVDELIIQAGAGIVFDSDPEKEFIETGMKMKVPKAAIAPFLQQVLSE